MVIRTNQSKLNSIFLDELDEEIKKCTKTCVDRVRENKDKKKKTKEEFEDENKAVEIKEKNQNVEKVDKNKQVQKCTHENGRNEKFCLDFVDEHSKDYRKKSQEICKKYFCPLCCEMSSSSFIFF